MELQKNVDDEIAKVVEAKKDAKHWKAQVDGLEEALQSTKAALATSHAEPVVPGVSISNDGTVAFNATDGLIAAQNGAGAALAMAGEAAKTGYQALVDAIPTDEAYKLGEDAVDAMYGAVDKGKAKTAEAYGNAWGYAGGQRVRRAGDAVPGRGESIRRVQQGRRRHFGCVLRQDSFII